jgi:predicted methyltransferase
MASNNQAAKPADNSLALHLLFKLRQLNSLSPWQLMCHQDKTLQEYYETLEHLKQTHLVEVADGKVRLTAEGEKYLEKEVGSLSPFEFKCSYCEGKGYLATDKNFLERYSKVLERRPLPSEKYDQTSISAEDAIIRVGFIHERGYLINKRMLMSVSSNTSTKLRSN